MAERKSFLVRIDEKTLDALKHWAEDDMRSLNGQIEFLLRRALAGSGRLKSELASSKDTEPTTSD